MLCFRQLCHVHRSASLATLRAVVQSCPSVKLLSLAGHNRISLNHLNLLSWFLQHEDTRAPAFYGAPLITTSAPARTTSSSSAADGSSPIHEGDEAAPGEMAFPVIVFSHGLGSMRTAASGLCCDMASHGYVVAAVEHRWGNFQTRKWKKIVLHELFCPWELLLLMCTGMVQRVQLSRGCPNQECQRGSWWMSGWIITSPRAREIHSLIQKAWANYH